MISWNFGWSLTAAFPLSLRCLSGVSPVSLRRLSGVSHEPSMEKFPDYPEKEPAFPKLSTNWSQRYPNGCRCELNFLKKSLVRDGSGFFSRIPFVALSVFW